MDEVSSICEEARQKFQRACREDVQQRATGHKGTEPPDRTDSAGGRRALQDPAGRRTTRDSWSCTLQGVRISELVSLRWQDWITEKNSIRLQSVLCCHRKHNRSCPTMRTLLIGVLLTLALTSCISNERETDNSLPAPSGEVIVLKDLLTPSEIVLAGSRIFALDAKDKRVSVYTSDGQFVHAFGRDGQGPGEFMRPTSLDVRKQYVVVTERSGRTSVFDTTGIFLHSFMAMGVLHFNSNMRILNDSLVLLGGFRSDPGNLYGGVMAHIYTIDGISRASFMPLTENAAMYETDLIIGASCDYDAMQSIWCTQPMEYTIRRYDYAGNFMDSIMVDPAYFQALHTKQPTNRNKIGSWLGSWDRPWTPYSINDSLLVCEVVLGERGTTIDLIHKKTGNVLSSYDPDGRLVYVDIDKQRLVFRRPATEEPVTTLEIVPLSALTDDRSVIASGSE